MTETLSHIALRRINSPSPTTLFRSSGVQEFRSSDNTLASNPSSPTSPPWEGLGEVFPFGGDGGGYYTPFPDVSVSLNGEGCLVIDAPGVCAQRLVTNDCAELHPDGRRFRIIGRKDNVINSGGIKIHAEEVEQMLRPHLSMPFIITKATDPKFGEVVALVYEEGSCGESIQSICQSVLPKYWQPRRYLPVAHILTTETGKPRRDISLYI
jgi:O-succinylbenzoic acid--CoA ligase